MSFLPEDDREWLNEKCLSYKELTQDSARGVVLKKHCLQEGKFLTPLPDGKIVPVKKADVLILIPSGYNTTALDSFYTNPILIVAATGMKPPNCDGTQQHFGRDWQFWSRHLQGDNAWRPGIDSLRTFWEIVKFEIGRA
jgi:E2/UBC family protein E